MLFPVTEPTPPFKKDPGAMRQLALATELPFLVAGGALVGGLIGYFVDHWLHTKPFLMIAIGALGFFAAVRDMLRRLDKTNANAPPKQ
jgi:F0F1-type ATP synthase assembly protein I